MKKIIWGVLLFLLALPLYAENRALEIVDNDGVEDNAEEIYNELKVKEVREEVKNNKETKTISVKKLSGLSCTYVRKWRPSRGSDFQCTLNANLNQEQLGEIYSALEEDLEIQEHPSTVGENVYVKELLSFTLKKRVVVSSSAKPTYQLIITYPRVTGEVEGKEGSAKEIYETLNIKRELINENIYEVARKKEVGPLSCKKIKMVSEETNEEYDFYHCKLVNKYGAKESREKIATVIGEDARVIYEALRVTEEYVRDPIPTFVDFVRSLKRVGTLQCAKSHFFGDPHYSCTLKGI